MTEQPIQDRIEREIEIKAPVARVWKALTDHEQFGVWFMVKLEGPFQLGKITKGLTTYKGFEHVKFWAKVTKLEHHRVFSYEWHPYAGEKGVDYSKEPPTTVEFTLEKTADGTSLKVIETGFKSLPKNRQVDAFRANEGGWEAQLRNIEVYVAKNP